MWQHGRARDRLAMLDTATGRARKSNRSHHEAFLLIVKYKRGIMRMPVAVVAQCEIRGTLCAARGMAGQILIFGEASGESASSARPAAHFLS